MNNFTVLAKLIKIGQLQQQEGDRQLVEAWIQFPLEAGVNVTASELQIRVSAWNKTAQQIAQYQLEASYIFYGYLRMVTLEKGAVKQKVAEMIVSRAYEVSPGVQAELAPSPDSAPPDVPASSVRKATRSRSKKEVAA